jgi:ParB family chromosome partitioning protein
MSKVPAKGIDIPIDKIKPSPFQPRLTFDLEDIKGSIIRDGILVSLTVRKKDGYYELVDGERRWRVAKELGYKTVPCDVIDIDDETARRMVWKVNTLRKDYEPKEKALFFKRMQEEYGMSIRGIAREYDQDPHTVIAYLNVFKLPKDYQQMIWDGVIAIGVIRELEQLFNGVEYSTPRGSF